MLGCTKDCVTGVPFGNTHVMTHGDDLSNDCLSPTTLNGTSVAERCRQTPRLSERARDKGQHRHTGLNNTDERSTLFPKFKNNTSSDPVGPSPSVQRLHKKGTLAQVVTSRMLDIFDWTKQRFSSNYYFNGLHFNIWE